VCVCVCVCVRARARVREWKFLREWILGGRRKTAKDGVKINLEQNADYSTFPYCTSIRLFPLSEEDSLPHPRNAIHLPRAKYDHFAFKYIESSKSEKVCFKNYW
jgi:hypothetical protein